jgi:glucosamine kinase
VQAAAEHIDDLVRELFALGAPRLTLIGGLATPMEAWLAPDVRRRLSPPLGDAIAGAMALAGRRL